MKLLAYIFLISLNYVLSDFVEDNAKKIVIKSYPKKVKPGLYQINNAGKYIKPKVTPTKKQRDDKEYTAFPYIHGELNLPDSPYFQAEKLPESQPRVKKVLPDYFGKSRNKRSVVPKKDDGKKKAVLKPLSGAKISDTQKMKPKKPIKRMQRKRINRKRHGNPPRHAEHRGGPKNKRNLKYKPRSLKRNHAKVRSRFGDKPTRKTLKDRRNITNATNIAQKGARRLIAARDAVIEDYPYVVSIQKEREHWCAGALLNPRLVITTANCLWKGSRVSRMHIRAGSRYTDHGGQTANIQEVMKHPGWKIRKQPDNDIALVLLDRNLKFSHSVHSVDLPNRVMMPAFEDAWITSWGAESRDGVFETKSNTLQVYHARILDRQKCNNVTQRFGVTVSDSFICLAQTGKRAPCTRDTGAPAVSDGVLWGLASWGIRKLCGTERFPAMFSYLGSQSNMDFIINATHYLMADERFDPFLDRMPRMGASPSTSTDYTTLLSFRG